MNRLVEYRVLDKLKVINEGTAANKKLKVRGRFQKCDEQNNNGRVYPRSILESQVKALQEKISERSLVGALDHPPNDAIHLSQASHVITKLSVEDNGDVMGEAEILSTPSGKIIEALLNDGVKIGISSRGLGTLSETKNGKVVNEDFKLITFDFVSDPSTKGAYPELTEAVKLNSEKAQKIVSKMKAEKILLTVLERKIDEKLSEARGSDDGYDAARDRWGMGGGYGGKRPKFYDIPKKKPEPKKEAPKEEKPKESPKGKQLKFKFAENAAIKAMVAIIKEGGNPINKAKKKEFESGYQGSISSVRSRGAARVAKRRGQDPIKASNRAKFRQSSQQGHSKVYAENIAIKNLSKAVESILLTCRNQKLSRFPQKTK